jgi:hypothetical protein
MGLRRVYVAGSITPRGNHSHPGIEFMSNIRKGIRASVDVIQKGYAVFCPFLDYQYLLVLEDDETLEPSHFYESSMAYLEVSDAVLVLPGWENSSGTKAEIERARLLKIPIFFNLQAMDNYFRDSKMGGVR